MKCFDTGYGTLETPYSRSVLRQRYHTSFPRTSFGTQNSKKASNKLHQDTIRKSSPMSLWFDTKIRCTDPIPQRGLLRDGLFLAPMELLTRLLSS